MGNRRKWVISLTALVILTGAVLFASKPPGNSVAETIAGRQQKPCGCYVCGLLDSVDFPNKDPNCTGIVAEDACPKEMAKLPDKGKAFCQKIKDRLKFASFKNSCPILAKACEMDKSEPTPDETKPEKPADPNPTPEPLSVASAATGDGLVEVTIRCPPGVNVKVDWPNHLGGSYQDTGGQEKNLEFDYGGGSVPPMSSSFLNRSGQMITCVYRNQQFNLNASYKYIVKREIVNCGYSYPNYIKCRVKP